MVMGDFPGWIKGGSSLKASFFVKVETVNINRLLMENAIPGPGRRDIFGTFFGTGAR